MSYPPGARGYERFGGRVGRTVAESESWWPPARRARTGAPNVIVVLLDDMGYSDIGPFGAEIDTPTLDRLAARGVRLTNYHTLSVCSPARAALLTGLNAHRAGFATVAGVEPGFPGYTMELAEDVLALPEILRAAGYATFAVGKWHLTRDAANHPAASRRSWPVQRGFDRYYGNMEGLTSQHHPHSLLVDNSPLQVDRYPDGYYLTDDLTDQAIAMLKALRAHDRAKPFFLYVAHNAVHGPLQAKPADIAKYRGRYALGWDRLREERFARQLTAGLFPEGTRLAPRNSEAGLDVPPWDSLSAEDQALFARYMEVYAAMVDNVDQNLGRLLATVEAFGELDNTIVLFTSDNGGTAEGGPRGTRSYFSQFVQNLTLPPEWQRDLPHDPALIGGPRLAIHYPRGWAMASNTPFRLYKTHIFAGGVRVPFLFSWPAGLGPTVEGGVRHQYQYVTDILPTLLALAGVDHPGERAGRPAQPIDGVSFAPVLRDAEARSTHPEQYAEHGGHRGYYRDGWKILTLHRPKTPYDDNEWQLFDVRKDPTETENLAAAFPEKVRELGAAWDAAAWANTVFPLDDGSGYLRSVRNPEEAEWQAPLRLLPGTPTVERYRASRLIQLRSFAVEIRLTRGVDDQGVLVAHGGQSGGYSLYVEQGRLWFAYNEYGALKEVDGGRLAPGARLVRLDAQAEPGFHWSFTLSVDGTAVGRLDDAAMLLFLAPLEGIDVGIDRRSPVSWAVYERYGPFPYSGQLEVVTYTPGEAAPCNPALVFRVARESARIAE
jgi:arylsulfatase A-like enzyme